jgi:hypothetical protein
MGHHDPWVGIAAVTTRALGLTFLSAATDGPGSAARTCLEARFHISVFLLVGTESFALAPCVPQPTALPPLAHTHQ